MSAEAYALRAPFAGSPPPRVGNPARSLFGDAVLVLFLLAQCLDGVFTYVGVLSFGLVIEANPLITGLMLNFGYGTALAGAKIVASGLGICLHVRQLHSAVAILTCFYLAVAVVPWTAILFF